jgi:hypothetical protein
VQDLMEAHLPTEADATSPLGPTPSAADPFPFEANDAVEVWKRKLQSPVYRREMRLWMERSGRYLPMIQEELRQRGMPEDLAYLAMIESGFTPKAYSPAHASGMWQFLSATARSYGLDVGPALDERRDPVRATDAALRHLGDLHRQFGSWYLAAAAYNAGSGRIERVLAQHAGGRRGEEALYWKIRPHLPKETAEYVPFLLAAATIAKDPESYGFAGLEYHSPLAYDEVGVPSGTRLDAVAEAAKVAVEDVNGLNTHLMKGVVPAGHEKVRVPAGRGLLVAEKLARATPRPSGVQNQPFPRLRRLLGVAQVEYGNPVGTREPEPMSRATAALGARVQDAEHHVDLHPFVRKDDRGIPDHQLLHVGGVWGDDPPRGEPLVLLFLLGRQEAPAGARFETAENRFVGVRGWPQEGHPLAKFPFGDRLLDEPGRVGRAKDVCALGDGVPAGPAGQAQR